MSLWLGALRGALWNTVETVGSQLTSLLLFVIFARLIAPESIGLVQLAITVLSFLTIFVEHGFSATIIRSASPSQAMLDTAFWLGFGGAVVLALGLSASAPAIAAAYDSPDLVAVLRALAWTLPLTTLSSVQTALLTRDLAFKTQAVRRLVAVLGGGVVGVALALRGAGIWSLVARFAVEAVLDCAAAWLLTEFRPGRQVSFTEAREFGRFGSRIVGSYSIGFLSRRTEDLLIGFALGPLALGYFSVASRAMQLVTEIALRAAQRTSVPVFSRIRDEPARLRQAYYRAVQLAALTACPIFVGLSAVAPELCSLLFGPTWLPVIPAMRILGFAGIPMAVSIYVAPVLTSSGKPVWLLRYTMIETALSVAAAASSLSFGVEGVCVAFVVRSFLVVPVVLLFMKHSIGTAPATTLLQLLAPTCSSLIMFAVLEMLRGVLPPLPTAVQLTVLIIAAVLSYSVSMWCLGRGTVVDALRMARTYRASGVAA